MSFISFPYEEKPSPIFRIVRRPIALVKVFSLKRKRWIEYTMIVDTGADYTVFPRSVAADLKINIEKECKEYLTKGVGGSERVFISTKNVLIQIGDSTLKIPVGFLDRDDIPPLLGRQECLDMFELTFTNFFTSFRK